MDALTYTAFYDTDIDDQGTYNQKNESLHNYSYDEIGNLVKDKQEKITGIDWNVYGKIKNIHKVDVTTTADISFKYDAQGNRVSKSINRTVDPPNPFNHPSDTYYVRDASGNVMAVYEIKYPTDFPDLSLMEHHIYGSQRLGVIEEYGYTADHSDNKYSRELGIKRYELSNHLGNVLNVVSDKKLGHVNGGSIDYYLSDVVSATDYYSFGSPMVNRNFSSEGYRYGFNGMEKDDEIKGEGNSYTTVERGYDPRLARWVSIDPITRVFESPFVSFANSPIYYKDPEGNTPGNGDDKTKKTGTDAGHGDKPEGKKWTDPGSCDNCDPKTMDKTKDIEKESDYALMVEEAVNSALKSYGVDNTRTRTEKEETPDGTKIKWRYDKVNDAGVDVFVSIHLNNGSDNQFLAFYEGGITNEAESKKLGESILTAVNGLAGYTVNSTSPQDATNTNPGSLGVLKYFKGEAGVLLEVGGVKSETNRTNIKTNAKEIGEKIAIGMYKYMYGKEPTIQTGTINGTPTATSSIPVQTNPAAVDATRVAPVMIPPPKKP